ncbi:flagellar assembly factor FliW [Lebetimonas natsushimae]|uniref:Flagellar assembly factor FliW n=1 Tax=Lebetimonas natsushimae TaxID=1936991 RepID=A0A292YGU4_9BACT|nr:flagellar assembly protein FliW [Lebetimonas natsushimae]GAX88080.1 flagellar assembly factor FliW [Lebetimonas natsushimae]
MKFLVKKPIPGFENISEVELQKIDDTFAILKDTDGNVLFTLVNPFILRNDYDFEVPADIKVLLDLNENSDIEVYSNVVMKEPITEAIVNFKAPFIFNKSNNTMAQVILENEGYLKIGDFVKE